MVTCPCSVASSSRELVRPSVIALTHRARDRNDLEEAHATLCSLSCCRPAPRIPTCCCRPGNIARSRSVRRCSSVSGIGCGVGSAGRLRWQTYAGYPRARSPPGTVSTSMSNRRPTAETRVVVCSVEKMRVAGERGALAMSAVSRVADLADHDHVGVLEDRAQPAGERQPRSGVHRDLVDAVEFVLDRVLDRDDLERRVVEFRAACRASSSCEPVGPVTSTMPLRQIDEPLDLGPVLGSEPDRLEREVHRLLVEDASPPTRRKSSARCRRRGYRPCGPQNRA